MLSVMRPLLVCTDINKKWTELSRNPELLTVVQETSTWKYNNSIHHLDRPQEHCLSLHRNADQCQSGLMVSIPRLYQLFHVIPPKHQAGLPFLDVFLSLPFLQTLSLKSLRLHLTDSKLGDWRLGTSSYQRSTRTRQQVISLDHLCLQIIQWGHSSKLTCHPCFFRSLKILPPM